jgi:hypothetical protein
VTQIQSGHKGSNVARGTAPRSDVDARFRKFPKQVRTWLKATPGIVALLMQLEAAVASNELSEADVVRLAKRWQENLPPRRGAVVNLRDFMQAELGLDLTGSRRSPRVRKRIRHKRRPVT